MFLPVAVDDGVQAMGYRQDGAFRERLSDGLLDELVRIVVNRGCRFVQKQDLGFPQQCSGQTNQLFLANT